MWENLFRHINNAAENIHIPDGNAENIPQFCMEYEQQIHAAAESIFEGPITASNPATILQMHPITKLCIDDA